MRVWHWKSWLLAALDVRPGYVGALAVGQDVGMLVVHVHVRVLLERMGDFLAATLVNARASLADRACCGSTSSAMRLTRRTWC